MNTQKTIQFLSKFETEIELINIFEYFNNENENFLFDDFREYVIDSILNFEIIYYSKAIAYLTENDNSLTRSLEIADEQGFEVKNLNSELLATLLYQDELYNEWGEIENEIMQYFEMFLLHPCLLFHQASGLQLSRLYTQQNRLLVYKFHLCN